MKIEKFKKDKNNTYKVYFNDGVIIDLYDDVIIKYNLLANKSIDNDKFNEITNYNDFLNGYYKSIKYINKKLRSEIEIEKYLNKLNVKNSDIKKIIKLLYKDGYLNRKNYIRAFINDKYNLTSDGISKIERDLTKSGFKNDEFISYLTSLDWKIKIEKLVDKRIKANHNLSNNLLKTKIIRDLVDLGYIKSDIINILEQKSFNDDFEILRKEYNKIYNKYKNKYNDKELDFKITKYLYSKGFNIEDINRVKYENEI